MIDAISNLLFKACMSVQKFKLTGLFWRSGGFQGNHGSMDFLVMAKDPCCVSLLVPLFSFGPSVQNRTQTNK